VEMTELLEQIRVVAEARRYTERSSEAKKTAYLEWERQNQSIINEAAEDAKRVSEAEAKLRELTLQAYQETGNKQPALGVGIREVVKLEYSPQDAYSWAVNHNMALKLDVSAFEKIAKEVK